MVITYTILNWVTEGINRLNLLLVPDHLALVLGTIGCIAKRRDNIGNVSEKRGCNNHNLNIIKKM